jgi:LPXTG-motif cell wall-anchored protein
MDAQDDDTTIPVRSQQDIYQQGLPRDATWNETTKTYDLVVVNSKGTQLPQTGGMGTLPVYLAGGTMMVVAALGLLRRQRPGRGGDVPCV